MNLDETKLKLKELGYQTRELTDNNLKIIKELISDLTSTADAYRQLKFKQTLDEQIEAHQVSQGSSQLQVLLKQNENLQKQLSSSFREQQREQKEYLNQISRLNQIVEDLKQENGALQQKSTNISRQNEDLRVKLERVLSGKLQTEHVDIKSNGIGVAPSELDSRFDPSASRLIVTLENKINMLQEQLDSSARDISMKDDLISIKDQELTQIKSLLQQLQQASEKKEMQDDTLASPIVKYFHDTILSLETKLSTAERELNQLKQTHNEGLATVKKQLMDEQIKSKNLQNELLSIQKKNVQNVSKKINETKVKSKFNLSKFQKASSQQQTQDLDELLQALETLVSDNQALLEKINEYELAFSKNGKFNPSVYKKLEDEKKQLSVRNQELSAEIRVIQDLTEKKENQFQKVKDNLYQLEIKHQTTLTKLKEKEQSLDIIGKDLQQHINQVNTLAQENSSLKLLLEQFAKNQNVTSTDIMKRSIRKIQINESSPKKQQDIQKNQNLVHLDYSRLQQEIKELSNQIEDKDLIIKKLQNEIKTLKSIHPIDARMSLMDFDKQRDQLLNEIDLKTETIAELNDKLALQTQEKEALQREAHKIKSELQTASSKLGNREAFISGKNEEISTLKKQLNSINESSKTQSEEIIKVKNELAQVLNDNQYLQQQVQALNLEKITIKQTHDEDSNQIKYLEEVIQAKNLEKDQIMTSYRKLVTDYNSIKSEFELNNKTLSILQSQEKVNIERIRQLEKQLQTTQEKLDLHSDKISQLKRIITDSKDLNTQQLKKELDIHYDEQTQKLGEQTQDYDQAQKFAALSSDSENSVTDATRLLKAKVLQELESFRLHNQDQQQLQTLSDKSFIIKDYSVRMDEKLQQEIDLTRKKLKKYEALIERRTKELGSDNKDSNFVDQSNLNSTHINDNLETTILTEISTEGAIAMNLLKQWKEQNELIRKQFDSQNQNQENVKSDDNVTSDYSVLNVMNASDQRRAQLEMENKRLMDLMRQVADDLQKAKVSP